VTVTETPAPTAAAPTRTSRLPLVAAAVTVLLWSSAFVGVRSAGHDLSAGSLALARLAVGSIVLGIVMLVRREPLPPARHLPGLLVCGLLWFGAYNVSLNAAERRVDAGTAAMLVNLGPVLIALLAGVVLREGFPRSLLTGAGVAFAGTVVIGLATARGGASATGVALCIITAMAYAGGVIAQKPLLRTLSPLQVTWAACTIGVVATLPWAGSLAHDARHASGGALAWAVYLGAFPTAVAFTTWAYALARTTAGRMGATTYLVPPLVVLLGWLVLRETPPGVALLGGVLCLTGVAITRRNR